MSRARAASYTPNAAWMTLSVAIGIAQGIAVTYVMARYLGLAGFGRLGLVIHAASLVLFASGSVTPSVLRLAALGEIRDRSLIGAGMLIQAAFALPALGAGVAALWASSRDASLVGPTVVLGLGLAARALVSPAIALQLGRDRMRWQLLESAHLVLALLLVLVLVALDTGLYALPFASLLATSLVGIVTVTRLRARERTAHDPGWRPAVRTLAGASAALGVVHLVQQAHWAVEPLLAPRLLAPDDVGLFIAGGRLLPAVRALATALTLVLLPTFVRAVAEHDHRALSRHAERLLRVLVPTGLLVTLVMCLGAPLIVRLLFPPHFAEATSLLRLLSLSAIPMLVHWHAAALLFAAERYRDLVVTYLAAGVVRIVLAAAGGGLYGVTGLGGAEVVADWVLACMLEACAIRRLALAHARAMWLSLAAGLAALAALALVGRTLSPALAVGVALVIFGVGMLLASRHAPATTMVE